MITRAAAKAKSHPGNPGASTSQMDDVYLAMENKVSKVLVDTIEEFHKNGNIRYNDGFLLRGGLNVITDTREVIFFTFDKAYGLLECLNIMKRLMNCLA